MTTPRLEQQINFILEIDALKRVERRSYLVDGSRHENSAEHSWHLAMMVLVLAEHANEEIDSQRVPMILLGHDIVEVDAGDTYIYDRANDDSYKDREAQAANRIYGLLPEEQGTLLREAWEEYEAQETPESHFATALDRLMPLMHNYHSKGKAWQEHNVTRSMVINMNQVMEKGSKTLWAFAMTLIDDAVARGYLGAD